MKGCGTQNWGSRFLISIHSGMAEVHFNEPEVCGGRQWADFSQGLCTQLFFDLFRIFLFFGVFLQGFTTFAPNLNKCGKWKAHGYEQGPFSSPLLFYASFFISFIWVDLGRGAGGGVRGALDKIRRSWFTSLDRRCPGNLWVFRHTASMPILISLTVV